MQPQLLVLSSITLNDIKEETPIGGMPPMGGGMPGMM